MSFSNSPQFPKTMTKLCLDIKENKPTIKHLLLLVWTASKVPYKIFGISNLEPIAGFETRCFVIRIVYFLILFNELRRK